VLRVSVPPGALPPNGQPYTVLRVAVTGQSLEGDAVSLERSGLSLPVLSSSAFGNLVATNWSLAALLSWLPRRP